MNSIRLSADDFGYDHKSVEFIVSKVKKFSIVSVLINFADSKTINKLPKDVDFGLHLNYIEGKPVSKGLKTLVDENGHFYPSPVLFLKAILGRIDVKEIEKETEQQIKKFLKSGRAIFELNSHQHLHAFYPFSEVTIKMAKKYSIKHIRSYKKVRRFTLKAKLGYLTLKLLAIISNFFGRRKIALPLTWVIDGEGSDVYLSWEGKSVDFSDLKIRERLTLVVHPNLPFDSNTSFYKIL
ncbi:ChbG/HpnK family deacetylase [Patescibacteria group bacterium]|nr:ChbG/HpnK family deacetylase [Patescibacteria group bacterium]